MAERDEKRNRELNGERDGENVEGWRERYGQRVAKEGLEREKEG